MKKVTWVLAAAMVVAHANHVLATDYNVPVTTTNTTLVAGDKVIIDSGANTAVSASTGSPALNITGGGITLENSSTGGGGVLTLSNGQINNLGVGSSLTRSGATNNPSSITLIGSTLLADQLTFNGGSIVLQNSSALNFSNSLFSSANTYLFATQGGGGSITLSDSTINHSPTDLSSTRTINSLVGDSINLSQVHINSSAAYAISIDRGTQTAVFNDLTIRHNPIAGSNSPTAIWMYADATITGQNLDIESDARSLYVGGGVDAKFSGTNRFVTQTGQTIAVHSLTSGQAKDTHLSLSNATVTSGNSMALLTQGDKATASLNNSTLTGAWAVYAVDQSQVTLNNSTLQMVNNSTTQTYVVLANTGATVNLQGTNSVNAVGNNLAMLAANTGNINANGLLISTGQIHAQTGAAINFALSNSIITGQITKDSSGIVNWNDQGSTWNVTGQSMLDDLTLGSGSVVNMQGISNDLTLTVNNLASSTTSNNPVLKLKANTQTLSADFVQVTNSSSGLFLVDIPNDASEINNGLQVLDLINSHDANASFTSTKKIEKGGYYYTVARNENDPSLWQLVPFLEDPSSQPEAGITSSGRGAANIAVASHLLNYASQQSLVDRLSAIRLNPTSMGSWARVYHGKTDFKNDRIKDSDLSYTGLQAGYDHVLSESNHASWLAGGMLEYIRGTQHYLDGKNKLNAYSAGLYLSHFYDNGLYFDSFLKYSILQNSVHAIDTAKQSVKGNDNSSALTLSAEVGRTVHFAKSQNGTFFVQPQLQLTASQIGNHTFKHSNGLTVQTQSEKSLLSRAGINLGYQFAQHPSTIYLKLDWMKEFDGDIGFSLNGSPEHVKMQGDWLEVGVGAQMAITPQQQIFFEAKGSNNSQFKERKFNLGYRWNF